jgi:death on curing protein
MRIRSSVTAVRPGCGTSACWKPRFFRPQTGYYPGLIEEAAALWESLSQNHPFVDGNKGTAFAIAYTFLAINGARLTTGASETEDLLLSLYATATFNFARLSQWLRENTAYDASE